MSTRKPQDNLWFHVYQLVVGFFASLRDTLVMLYESAFQQKKQKKMEPNHFLSSIHFFIHEFPKTFWKYPTGIGIGRSIGTIMLYFF
jgi:uncharacterized membrane protein SpoIIM required for sporulation